MDVLELCIEHGDGHVSHQVLRSGLSSNVLPSPPQRYFELCKLAKRVAKDRLHQHCRDVSKQYRTTRSDLQMQACKTYFRTFVLLARSIFWPIIGVLGFTTACCWWIFLDLMRFCVFEHSWLEHFSEPKISTSNTLNRNSIVYSALGGRKCGRIPRAC